MFLGNVAALTTCQQCQVVEEEIISLSSWILAICYSQSEEAASYIMHDTACIVRDATYKYRAWAYV